MRDNAITPDLVLFKEKTADILSKIICEPKAVRAPHAREDVDERRLKLAHDRHGGEPTECVELRLNVKFYICSQLS